MEDELGISVGLGSSFEDEVAGGLEGGAVEGGGHRLVGGIARVLAVHDLRHAPHRGHHLVLADDAVNGFLFELPKIGVWDAKLEGLWENAPIQANDLTKVRWTE